MTRSERIDAAVRLAMGQGTVTAMRPERPEYFLMATRKFVERVQREYDTIFYYEIIGKWRDRLAATT